MPDSPDHFLPLCRSRFKAASFLAVLLSLFHCANAYHRLKKAAITKIPKITARAILQAGLEYLNVVSVPIPFIALLREIVCRILPAAARNLARTP